MDDPWCRNSLVILSPDEQALSAFRNTLNTPHSKGTVVLFSLHQTVPRPDGQKEGKREWAFENWGCQCDDLRNVRIEEYPGKICIHFWSAYRPPIPWMQKVAKRFNVMMTNHYNMAGEKLMELEIGPTGIIRHHEHVWVLPMSTSSEGEQRSSLFEEA